MNDFALLPSAFDVLVVARGDLLSPDEMRDLSGRAAHTIVCDGALGQYYSLTLCAPEVIVGDGDSVQPELMERLGVSIVKVPEQETNDLTKSVRYALAQGWTRMVIVGISGRREDHTIANISLLPSYYGMGVEVTAVTPYGVFVPFAGDREFHLPIRTQISFFTFDHQPLSAAGVAYPFESRVFTELWQASLNEVTSPTVSLRAEGIALAYIAFEQKYTHR